MDIAAPVLIFWVFIYDMTYITAARILTGKVRSFHDWIAYVGRDHLHHRLAALLGSKRKAVLLVFGFSVCMGLAAVALVHARGFEAALLILQAVLDRRHLLGSGARGKSVSRCQKRDGSEGGAGKRRFQSSSAQRPRWRRESYLSARYRRIRLIRRAVMPQRGFRRALELRDDALREDLAQLDAPLVERVNLPDGPLGEDRVLVQGDELRRACPA